MTLNYDDLKRMGVVAVLTRSRSEKADIAGGFRQERWDYVQTDYPVEAVGLALTEEAARAYMAGAGQCILPGGHGAGRMTLEQWRDRETRVVTTKTSNVYEYAEAVSAE